MLADVGELGNVARSLMEAGALATMDVRVACPPDLAPAPEVQRARREKVNAILDEHHPTARSRSRSSGAARHGRCRRVRRRRQPDMGCAGAVAPGAT